MEWIWYFTIYSFFGFLLEVAFAWVTGGERERKGLLVLPMCPVYGLGACAILALAPLARGNPFGIAFLGGLAATGVEYLMAVWYERGLGVSFWNYEGMPGNIQGRVCLPFSAAWSLLALGLVWWVQPWTAQWVAAIPGAVTIVMVVLVGVDLIVSTIMMKHTGGRTCLCWYRREQ